jgi:hypothetical protein
MEGISSSTSAPLALTETGPYVFRSLLDDVPLSTDGEKDDIEITCVEFLGAYNIYCIRCLGANILTILRHTRAEHVQTRISTLEPLPPKSSTSSRYLPTLRMYQEGHHIY